ncbi:MAG: hypothetical protein FJX75_29130, partial [Armatimonadetes bacterium]|nr:hypothetical protein [Armatimonadota bacterium]
DPYLYLVLPEGGISAADCRTLQVHLYSSAPADLLDIYYKTAAGYWCLGGSLPIKAGWGVYTTDLLANQWRETDFPEARKWGGPDGKVISFRIDPGNQEQRWVIVDWVRLTGERVATAYQPDPRVEGAKVTVQAPASVEAGKPVDVELSLDLPAGARGRTVTACARLQTPAELMAVEQRRVTVEATTQRVAFSLPTLPFVSAQATLYAGILEALGPDESEAPCGEVRVVAETPKGTDFPQCVVRPVGGSPAVQVNGKAIPLMCFCGLDPLSELDGARKPRHVEMAEAGIRIMSDWFGTSGAGNLGHVAEDKYDYASFDLYFARMAQQIPDALFLPHVYVTPPVWWTQAHPEELVRFEDGTTGLQSFASERWRKEMGEDLVRLIRHLRSQPYADKIIGLIICSGYTAEWQTWGVWNDKFTDFSGPGLKAWREWLTRRYGADEALRKAWGQADASIAAAVPASAEARKGAAHFMLRDPQAEAQTIDTLTFLNELDAEAILHFARLGKEASDGRLLMGTYYGYLTQHHYHQAESGHCGIETVLASTDIDFLMSPPTYTERGIKEVSAFMSAVDSVQRHGKIWLSEADYRTYLSDPGDGYGRTDTAEDSVSVLWREFAHVLCKRAGVSWFDMDTGWLSGPVIPGELARMQKMMADYLPQRKPQHAEVAAFIDPRSFYYLKPDQRLLLYITLEPMLNLYRSGAPFDLYVLSDLKDESLPDYRMYVFLNAYALDAETRAVIQRRTRRPGVAALWHWAPGYCFPDEPGAQHAVPLQRQGRLATLDEMQALTGVKVRQVGEQLTPRLSAEGAPERYAARLAAVDDAGKPSLPLGPLFVPEEGEVLARLEPGGLPGLVKADNGEATTFFSVLPCLPPTVIRQVYLDAGVKLITDTDDCVYGDGEWVGVHSKETGITTLRNSKGEGR